CWKKVAEGILDKIHTASNKADLKKEIKKLQKSRDQIKSWISSNDIKDKRALVDNRKLIGQMERFKACEKELKTKAFSKEGLQGWSQKKRGKDSSKAERLAEIDNILVRHKHHINRLEIVNRLLQNGNLSMDAVKGVKDSIGFEEDEYIYEDLNLDDAEIFGFNKEDEDSEDSEEEPVVVEEPKKKIEETPATSPSKPAKATPTRSVPVPKEEPAPVIQKGPPTPVKIAKANSVPVKPPMATVKPAEPVAAAPGRYAAAAAAGASQSDAPRGTTPLPSSSTPLPSEDKRISTKKPDSSLKSLSGLPSALTKPLSIADLKDEPINTPAPINNQLPPSVADLVSSFEVTKDRCETFSNKAKDENGAYSKFIQEMLNTSFQHLPEPNDSERPKYYFPQNPYPTPSYFPDTPLAVFENPAIFEMFDLDTLFFIFYYQQGTYQQYLAARELKKHAWRFHKKYQTWKKNDFRFEYKWLEDEALA
ncbi:hypothetical protein BC829DRAFT_412294, partial [Chytridium lagenaria]